MSSLFSLAFRFGRARTLTSSSLFRSIISRQSAHFYACIRQKNTCILNNAHLKFCSGVNHLLNFSSVIPTRTITYYSRRKGKRKTVKAVIRRFRRTGSGKWKRWQAGKNHFNSKKTSKRRSRLRRYVICNKQQTKMLNKMVNGW